MRGLKSGLGVVLAAAVLTACGGGEGSQTGQSTPNTSSEAPPATAQQPERTAFDPPKVFEKTSAKFPSQTFFHRDRKLATLHDGYIYSVKANELNAFDGLTARPLWSVPGQISTGTEPLGKPPHVHQDKVYAAFSGSEPAKGTTPAHPKIEVVAVDVKSGEKDWSATIDIDLKGATSTMGGEVAVVGASDSSVVVTYFDDSTNVGLTYVIDRNTHQVRWSKDQFLAGEVDSGMVVGNGGKPFIGEPRTLTGLAETDGAEKWSTPLGGYGTTLMPISPKLVASNRKVYSSGDYQFDILDVTTGKALYSLATDVPSMLSYNVACFYDQVSIIVCDGNSERTFAFEATNVGPNTLWEIKDGPDRVAPTITAAYHGLVYGKGANDPVALDAKTGKDAPDAPGVSPDMVDKYLAVDKGATYKPVK
ncbi:PQQ-binding-like beta-propeller repeat protein [Kibdelosporangium persicum]